jgi:hypothetical protein
VLADAVLAAAGALSLIGDRRTRRWLLRRALLPELARPRACDGRSERHYLTTTPNHGRRPGRSRSERHLDRGSGNFAYPAFESFRRQCDQRASPSGSSSWQLRPRAFITWGSSPTRTRRTGARPDGGERGDSRVLAAIARGRRRVRLRDARRHLGHQPRGRCGPASEPGQPASWARRSARLAMRVNRRWLSFYHPDIVPGDDDLYA